MTALGALNPIAVHPGRKSLAPDVPDMPSYRGPFLANSRRSHSLCLGIMKLVSPTVMRTLAFLSAVAVALPRPGQATEHRVQDKQGSAMRTENTASNRVLEIRC